MFKTKFEKFLEENKIDLGSLKAANDDCIFGEVTPEDRYFKQMQAYREAHEPLSQNEQRRIELEKETAKLFHTQEACSDLCGNLHDVPFLSPEEGICFRNCVGKFNNLESKLRLFQQNNNAAFLRRLHKQQVDEKNGLAHIYEDPKAEEIREYLEKRGPMLNFQSVLPPGSV